MMVYSRDLKGHNAGGKMKRVLVWNSKHGKIYYDASTQELLERASVDILRILVLDGLAWDPGPIRVTWDEDIANITDPEILVLPVNLQAIVEQKREQAQATREREVNFHEGERLMWESVNAALSGAPLVVDVPLPDGAVVQRQYTAWAILQQRNGWEFEDYELANVR